MFGFNSYTKPGKGIGKNEPKKTGFDLFFDIFKREFWAICGLNLLFIVCCLPIVTIGASYAAMHSVLVKMVRDTPILLMADFKKGFKDNFKQGTIAMFINILCCAFLFIAYFFYLEVFPVLSYVIIGVTAIITMFGNYVFPLLVSVELPLKAIYKNSVMIGMLCLGQTVLNVIYFYGIITLGVLMFPVSIPYVIFIGFSLSALVNCFMAYKGIKKYAIAPPPPEEIVDEQ